MIVVDYREPQEVASHLSLALAGETEVHIDNLVAGDIWWPSESGTYGFELKSTSDMLSSMWSKENGERLEWQLGRLREFVDVPALAHHGIIVGNGPTIDLVKEPKKGYGKYGQEYQAKVIASTGYNKSSVAAFLWSVQHPQDSKSIAMIMASTKDDLLDQIVTIYHWSQKTKHKTFQHETNRLAAGLDPNLGALLGAGIGEKKAKALLTAFSNSALAVIQADEKQILDVKGVGADTVHRLRKLWP